MGITLIYKKEGRKRKTAKQKNKTMNGGWATAPVTCKRKCGASGAETHLLETPNPAGAPEKPVLAPVLLGSTLSLPLPIFSFATQMKIGLVVETWGGA